MNADVGKRAIAGVSLAALALLAGCSSPEHTSASASETSSTATAVTVVSPSPDTVSGGAPSGTSAAVPTATSSATPSGTSATTQTSSTAPPSVSQPPSSAATGSTTVANPPSASSPERCLSGTFSVVYPATDNPVRSACVHLGTSVNVELLALRGVTWEVPSVSDPSVATVADQVTPPGTRHDHVTLLRTGTVTVTSASSYNPDPNGPPSRQWTLTLVVVP
jgi:hypothetical protein